MNEAIDDLDLKDISQPKSFMIRSDQPNEDGRELFWSNAEGWVPYSEADIFSHEDTKVLHLPVGGAWVEMNESQSAAVEQSADLKEVITTSVSEGIDNLFSGQGFLVQRQWHPQGQMLPVVRDNKTLRAYFGSPTLTVRAVMRGGDSAKVFDGQLGIARKIANELNEELTRLLPEQARAWPRAPKWDRFNEQWEFQFHVVLREGTEDFEGEYKDLYVGAVPPDFAKPEAVSEDGARAWEVIVSVLGQNDDLHSGGHTHVFYTPEAWAAKREQYGEGSVLIVVHDGGQHAPYFNSSYGGYILQTKMEVALRRAGFYPQPMTGWGTAIYKLDKPDPEMVSALEQEIARREHVSNPEIERLVKAARKHAFESQEDDLVKELSVDPLAARVEQIVSETGLELVRTAPRVGSVTVQGMGSGIVYAKVPRPHPLGKSIKAVALDLAKRADAKLRAELPEARPFSWSTYEDKLGDQYVAFWFTRSGLGEASEDFELTMPEGKEQRIRQLFTTLGLHIESMVEEPKDDPERGWGKLGEAKRFVTAVLQPDSSRPWTVSASGSQGLAEFCRQVASSLGEILETMDVDWTTRWDNELGAWRIKWYIGDPGITKHRVIEAFGDFDEPVKEIATPSKDFEPGDIVRCPNSHWPEMEGVIKHRIGHVYDEPQNYYWHVEWGRHPSLDGGVRSSELELVRRPTMQEGIGEPDEEEWKDLVSQHTNSAKVEEIMALNGIISVTSRMGKGIPDDIVPETYRLFHGHWKPKVAWEGPGGAAELGMKIRRELQQEGIPKDHIHFYHDFASGDIEVAVYRGDLGESIVQEAIDDDDEDFDPHELVQYSPMQQGVVIMQRFGLRGVKMLRSDTRIVFVGYAPKDVIIRKKELEDAMCQELHAVVSQVLIEPKRDRTKYSIAAIPADEKLEPTLQEGIDIEPLTMLVEAGALVRRVKEVEGELKVSGEWPEDGEFNLVLPLAEQQIGEDSRDGDDNRVAIVGVFRKKDEGHEVLVCKREVDPEAGKWCIPGGHAQVGEGIIDGAKREMKEETHLDLDDLTFVKDMPNEERDATVYVYGTMLPDGDKARAGDDAEKLKWVPLDDMPPLAFDNNELVKEIAVKMGLIEKEETEPEPALAESKQVTEAKHSKKGLLIVFEGIDGAGKTTQVRRLCDWLNDHDRSFVTTKWNNSKLLSDVLWKAKRKKVLTPMLFSLMHASDMHLRYEKQILPALAEGKVIVADRYYFTSYVRDQIRGIDEEMLDHVYKEFVEPDLVFHCTVPVRIAVERLMKDRGVGYYSSGQDVGYDVKGREASTEKYEADMARRYEKLFKGKDNVVELEMDRPIKEIAKEIKKVMRKLLGLDEALEDDPDLATNTGQTVEQALRSAGMKINTVRNDGPWVVYEGETNFQIFSSVGELVRYFSRYLPQAGISMGDVEFETEAPGRLTVKVNRASLHV